MNLLTSVVSPTSLRPKRTGPQADFSFDGFGISDTVSIYKYGRKVQNMFYNFEERVEAIYGTPELTDKLLDRRMHVN